MATGRIVDLWHRKDRTRTARYGTGKRWQAVWSNGKGAEEKKSFDYKDRAQAWLDAKTTDNTLNPYGLMPSTEFQEFWETWRKTKDHLRFATRRNIDNFGRNQIIPSFTGKFLSEITRSNVQDAVNEWSKELSPSTVALVYTYTRQVFKEAVAEKYLRESPCRKISLPEVHKSEYTFSGDLLEQLVDILDEPFATAARIAAATGLRPGELIGLSKQDIDFPRGVIRVTLQDDGRRAGQLSRGPLKTKSSRRTVSFGPVVRGLLLALCNDPGPEGRLFHDNGAFVSTYAYWAAWRKARKTLPEIGSGWHQLRHYHASVLISAGFSPVAVGARLGHKDATETLRTYGHLWDADAGRMAEVSDTVVAA